jgi:hypothetical protein
LEVGIPTQVKVKRRMGEPSLISHVEAMHHALAVSKETYLKYVQKNMPRIYGDMENLLDSKGEEAVLRSLRVIESGHKVYPP